MRPDVIPSSSPDSLSVECVMVSGSVGSLNPGRQRSCAGSLSAKIRKSKRKWLRSREQQKFQVTECMRLALPSATQSC